MLAIFALPKIGQYLYEIGRNLSSINRIDYK